MVQHNLDNHFQGMNKNFISAPPPQTLLTQLFLVLNGCVIKMDTDLHSFTLMHNLSQMYTVLNNGLQSYIDVRAQSNTYVYKKDLCQCRKLKDMDEVVIVVVPGQ